MTQQILIYLLVLFSFSGYAQECDSNFYPQKEKLLIDYCLGNEYKVLYIRDENKVDGYTVSFKIYSDDWTVWCWQSKNSSDSIFNLLFDPLNDASLDAALTFERDTLNYSDYHTTAIIESKISKRTEDGILKRQKSFPSMGLINIKYADTIFCIYLIARSSELNDSVLSIKFTELLNFLKPRRAISISEADCDQLLSDYVSAFVINEDTSRLNISLQSSCFDINDDSEFLVAYDYKIGGSELGTTACYKLNSFGCRLGIRHLHIYEEALAREYVNQETMVRKLARIKRN